MSLSVEIRINLISIIRMLIRFGKHLGGFKILDGKSDLPEDLTRITYLETIPGIELLPEELEIDKTRKIDELKHLGKIGSPDPKEPYQKFPEAIESIEKTCRELVSKLYTGENAKYLVGD